MSKYLNPDLEKAYKKTKARVELMGDKKGIYFVQNEKTGDLYKFYDFTPAEIFNIMARLKSTNPFIVEASARDYNPRSITCYTIQGRLKIDKLNLTIPIQ